MNALRSANSSQRQCLQASMYQRYHALIPVVICLLSIFLLSNLALAQLELTERYPAPPLAYDIAVADFNGDGFDDFAVGSLLGVLEISIHLSKGDGTFQPAVFLNVGDQPCCLVAGDFNQDGKPDLAVVAALDPAVHILLGNGDGTFQNSIVIPGGGQFIRAGDLNGDGKLDLVISVSFPRCLGVLLGNGDGTFQAARCDRQIWVVPVTFAIADFNHDGILDLAAPISGELGIFFGNGDGTLQQPHTYRLATDPRWITVADLNGDGNPDVALADAENWSVSVLLGNADGTFQAVQEFPADYAEGIVAADFNRDGKVDLAFAGFDDPGEAGVLLGHGDGTFDPPFVWITDADRARVAAVGDFNGDGIPDLANTGYLSDTVTVLLGTGAMKFNPGNPLVFPTSGTQPVSQIVRLTNTGATSLAVQSITVSKDFSFVSGCGKAIAPGITCQVKITFQSRGISQDGELLILDGASPKPQPVILHGIVR